MPQKEITGPVQALDDQGKPRNFGWSRGANFLYDSALIRTPRRHVTESDRYIFFSSTHLIILEILDNGFFGYVGMSVVSLRDKKRSTQTYTIPFPLGGFQLSGDSNAGSVRFKEKNLVLDFTAMDGGARIIIVDIPKFGRHRSLRGEVVLTPPKDAESMVTNMPWREKKHAFRCLRHSPWYTVEGVIQFGSSELVFTQGSAWGIFEWNRGIRPRRDVRYWAAGAGLGGGRLGGFNVGYDSADSAEGTENAFFLDGRLHKLDQVTFHIPPYNWLQPWRFTSNDNRLEMTFAPHQERSENHQMFFHYHKRRQVCGCFSGKVILDDGAPFEFQNFMGFAERKKTQF
jgi:hypothetical protein